MEVDLVIIFTECWALFLQDEKSVLVTTFEHKAYKLAKKILGSSRLLQLDSTDEVISNLSLIFTLSTA